jgi:hypothetical protein
VFWLFGHWAIGIYLGFGIWLLEFTPLSFSQFLLDISYTIALSFLARDRLHVIIFKTKNIKNSK